ncbi:MAG: hypothetical protein BHW01_05025 [Clostridium sp. 27_14]|nr:MAG: hypothetical protein BHW01_05025 [Clostridium sp. 27_14]
MPKETFLKLPEEKKNKIIKAAKKEFERVPFEQTSIKNIVEDAEIARGSFYQYFESKYGYILNIHFKEMNEQMQENIIKAKGDIFQIFISMYDCVDNNLIKNEDMEFYKKIFNNLKTSEDSKIFKKFVEEKPKKIKDFYEYIDTSNLKINTKEEFEIVEKILFTITTKAIVMRFKYDSKENARENYLKQIEYLKYGIVKNIEK